MSDRFQKVVNINAPLLKQQAQIVRQCVGDAAFTGVPTLHRAKRNVEVTGKSGLPAKPVEGFANSGKLIAGHFLVTTKVQKIADGTLMLAPLQRKHFSHALINFFRFLVGKNSFSRAVVNDFARVIIKMKIHLIHKERVYVALGLVDGFNLHAVVNGHIGLLTVLSRPVADSVELVAGHLRQFARVDDDFFWVNRDFHACNLSVIRMLQDYFGVEKFPKIIAAKLLTGFVPVRLVFRWVTSLKIKQTIFESAIVNIAAGCANVCALVFSNKPVFAFVLADKVSKLFKLRFAKCNCSHLGLLTVLARPVAVAYGHNIATSSVDCKGVA